MKKLEPIIFSFIFALLIVFFFAPSARAATCSYQCNNLSQYDQSHGPDFCHSLGGVITSNILTDCPTPANCGLGNVPVCCCNTGNFSLNNGQLTNNAAAPVKDPPKFTIPELSVKIPGMAEFSQGSCQTDSSGKTTCAVNWIGEYVGGIYKYATGIAGIIAVIVLMLAGIIWLVSGGDASQIGKSKEMIIGAVSGLVILLCSYILLYQINPELTRFKSLTLGYISEVDEFAKSKLGGQAENYKNMPCPTETELNQGVEFYATGYFKMPWKEDQDIEYLCMVSMQGTCPGKGTNSGASCIKDGKYIFPDYPSYRPCHEFTKAEYDAHYFQGRDLRPNETIAGPIACGGQLAMSKEVCFNNKTYKITDSGGGIKGRRIDILSTSLANAISNTKTGILKAGPCN